MFTIPKSTVQAAIKCAAKKDVRFYLQSVCVDVASNGDVHIISTDGTVLFASLIAAPNVNWTSDKQSGPFQILIPYDAAVLACKAKQPMLALAALPDGRYTLGDTVFAPVDGKFPDWRRVTRWQESTPAEASDFDFELLVRCSDALRLFFNLPKLNPKLHQFGSSTAFMTGPDMTGFCVAMPMRLEPYFLNVRPFTPAV